MDRKMIYQCTCATKKNLDYLLFLEFRMITLVKGGGGSNTKLDKIFIYIISLSLFTTIL